MKADSNCLDPKYPMAPKEHQHLYLTSDAKYVVAGPVKRGA